MSPWTRRRIQVQEQQKTPIEIFAKFESDQWEGFFELGEKALNRLGAACPTPK